MFENVNRPPHVEHMRHDASDRLAVVDQHGRVHGLDGLRVVDASIMPDCVRANINATVMMMAERLAAA
jgi:choline dehydrogenase